MKKELCPRCDSPNLEVESGYGEARCSCNDCGFEAKVYEHGFEPKVIE